MIALLLAWLLLRDPDLSRCAFDTLNATLHATTRTWDDSCVFAT